MKTFTKLNARFAKFGGPVFLEGQDIYTTDTVKNHPFGTIAYADHGKMFRYALAGGVDLVAGNLLQSAAVDTQFTDMAVLATAIVQPYNGVQTGNVTNGTTTVVPNDYKGGQLLVSVTPDLGSEYTVTDITGTLTSGGALVVSLDHPLTTAWSTATKVTMKKNPWADVIQMPASTPTGMPVGVANYIIKTATYGWVQTHGLCSVLSDGQTFAVGSDLGTDSATAGCVTIYAAGTSHGRVGYAMEANDIGKQVSVFLQID